MHIELEDKFLTNVRNLSTTHNFILMDIKFDPIVEHDEILLRDFKCLIYFWVNIPWSLRLRRPSNKSPNIIVQDL